ncbi:MAG: bifunctional UDP-N-acetylglucosamine diphosphorylase/glucosamine-1-phosphate N-acetyltransferase GlmU [Elusimicrobia bacterium]|nr:bifunctional UDP-N-acetylglucosamine diphosphorylase/glucosamine-1-phosphate N-acetyltransferase GlmU [Elusimicrobiota bacterium]
MPQKNELGVLILAAGLGTRMKSDLPKVLHMLGDMPLLTRVIKKIAHLNPSKIVIVVGHKAKMVKEALGGFLEKYPVKAPHFFGNRAKVRGKAEIVFVTQKLLKGSGRAVQEAAPEIKKFRHTLVLCGDAPLFRTETLIKMRAFYLKNRPDCAVLTADLAEPGGYGRIKRDPPKLGGVEAIIEAPDASPAELAIKEVNSGAYFFSTRALLAAIKRLKRKGSKKEYYLTDSVENILKAGGQVLAFKTSDETEITGINSRKDLAGAYKMLNKRVLEKLMAGGVTIADPENTYIEEGVKIGRDTVVAPGMHIRGATVIGKNCKLGPYGLVEDCKIEDGVEIKFFSVLTLSRVRKGSVIGPFAHLRPASDVGPDGKVGNFSEIKKSRIGRGSKVPHLSYVGDTEMGERVNVGAGTITCNYNGSAKHKTIIGKRAFIGSNTNLVAPVKVGAGARIAAGSTITEDVPPGTLALARARQIIKKLKKRPAPLETHKR